MSDSSRVIAVVEVKSLSSTDTDMVGTLKQKIRRKVGQEHEISLGEVIFVPRGSIQRTTSGKIQRGATRDLFRQRKLPSLG